MRKDREWRTGFLILMLMLIMASVGQVRADGRSYAPEDAEILAKTVWGEARGCSSTQQAAVVWCILNRVDSSLFPNTIQKVVTQPYQFSGYSVGNPVDPAILNLVNDVLSRWSIERSCIAEVGRVLPESYLYFAGNGMENRFTEHYAAGPVWDWSIESPYDNIAANFRAAGI